MNKKKISNSTILGNDNQKIRNEYFFWLCAKIERRQDAHRTQELASLLHSIEFKWFVPLDDNRAEDGKDLREEFCRQMEQPCESQLTGPCSVLEMLIALAVKMDMVLTDNPENYYIQKWFWEMVDNLGLTAYDEAKNRRIIDTFINRTYTREGKGGLFPLRKARLDQRKVEIWYQFMAYAEERYPI